MKFKQYLILEADCASKEGDAKTNCVINNLKGKIAELKQKKASLDDPEKKQDIEYQIDSLIDLIDAEEEKRDSREDTEKIKKD